MSHTDDARLMRFEGATRQDEAVERWFADDTSGLRAIARRWFDEMVACGPDVTMLLHDGHPTACVRGAAFGYVNAFTAHVNVGFFLGARLPDPEGLLEGTGKFMRHVKLRPDAQVPDAALCVLIRTAYADMRARLERA